MEQERSLVVGEACIGRFHDCGDVCCHVGDVYDFAAEGKDARHRNARQAVELREDHQIEDASLLLLRWSMTMRGTRILRRTSTKFEKKSQQDRMFSPNSARTR